MTVGGTAARHPDVDAVVRLLDQHFTAINNRDYPTWTTTVIAKCAADQSASSWLEAFRSTIDGAVIVAGISAGSTGLTVDLSFVSTQEPADAPENLQVGRICWDAHWPVEDIDAGGRIGIPVKGLTTKRAC